MLYTELIFVLKLLNLFLGCFLIMLLILCGGLDARFHFLTNEKNLTVLIV